MKRYSFFLFLFTITYLSVYGQNKKITFQSIQEGLSHHHVKCILKDSEGFMWFGTYDGLTKFDGTNFLIYENNPADTMSLRHNTVNTIIEDRYKNIWIGTSNGLNLYDREKDNFTVVENFGRLANFYISALYYDGFDLLWIGTSGNGLYLLDMANDNLYSFSHKINESGSILSNFISSIVSDNDNNIWVGTRSGLNMYNRADKNFIHFINDPGNPGSLSNNSIGSLTIDKDGVLWIGTYGGGLDKLMKKDGKYIFTHFQKSDKPGSISHNNILSMCTDHKGNLWIGTENGGLSCLFRNSGKFTGFYSQDGDPGSLGDNSIWSVYEDNTGIIWIGTYNHGLNIIDEKYDKFELVQKNYFIKNTLVNNNVKGFAEDNQENLWIATDGGGLGYFNTKTRQFENKFNNSSLSSKSIITVLCDSKQNIWAGTWAGGIERLNKYGTKVKNYKNQEGLGPGNNIRCIFEDNQGNIWAGTSGNGLYIYNMGPDKFLPVTDNYKTSHLTNTSYVAAIKQDSDNNVWVGTLFGLVSINRTKEGKLKFYEYLHTSDPKSISSFRITYIFEDSKKNLWIGTEDGLNLFNKHDSTFTVYQKQNGLPNNNINGILEDNKGNLWISTNKGISKFNVSDEDFTNFSKEDGLNTNEFNPHACIKTRSGEFFFGGNNGMNAFYPDSIKLNTYIPSVYITDLLISNNKVEIGDKGSPLKKNITETRKITLTHRQSSFSIAYVALNYTRSLKNQYAFMLEGFEDTWNYVGKRRLATYTNLDPGNYVFKVKGSNNDGVWNETPTELKITILPPWWKTIWAYFLYFSIFFILLFAFLKLLITKSKQSQIIKLERIKREKDEELNNLKLKFFSNISHELRTPLTLILSPLENILSSKGLNNITKNKLGLIYRNANQLYRLVNELMDFSKSEKNNLGITVQQGDIVKFTHEVFRFYKEISERRNINYIFSPDNDRIDVWFDRDKFERILLNLLSNAFKFTMDGGMVRVKVEKTQNIKIDETHTAKDYVKISVIDNGQGISEKYIDKIFDRFFQVPDAGVANQAGTGIGLSLVKNLIELHHGKITVHSEKWKETCFSVYLPLGCSHFSEIEIINTPLDISSNINVPGEINHDRKKEKTGALENAPVLLIIEDNYELRKYIVSELSQQYITLEAEDGESGFKMAVENTPDLIISDIIMPGMTGIDLCKKIKQDFNTSHVPVILLTAKITLEEQIEGIGTGADAYITKPFNYNYLETTISNLIENRRKLFKRYSQDVFILPKELTNNKNDQTFLEKVVQYIDKNILNENLSVEEISSHLLLSHSQTYRKIKALTGQSVIEFINTIRLKKAIKLFEPGELNISEVAFKVGFNSPAYFTKCFKNQFGKSPSAFFSSNKNTSEKPD